MNCTVLQVKLPCEIEDAILGLTIRIRPNDDGGCSIYFDKHDDGLMSIGARRDMQFDKDGQFVGAGTTMACAVNTPDGMKTEYRITNIDEIAKDILDKRSIVVNLNGRDAIHFKYDPLAGRVSIEVCSLHDGTPHSTCCRSFIVSERDSDKFLESFRKTWDEITSSACGHLLSAAIEHEKRRGEAILTV